MTSYDPIVEEMRDLIWAVESGDATAAQIARLNELVANNLTARRCYIETTQVMAKLQWDTRSLPNLAQLATVPTVARSSDEGVLTGPWWQKFNTPLAASLSIATLFMLCLILSLGLIRAQLGNQNPVGVEPASSDWVARLTATNNCLWSELDDEGNSVVTKELPGVAAHGGRDLKAGRLLSLVSGRAEFLFDSGARVILEGPAELRLLNNNGAALSTGRLVAKVPPAAVGFTIDAPNTRSIDLGTEFGVEVKPLAYTEVHVLDGRVETRVLDNRGKETRSLMLSKNDAVRVAVSANTKPIVTTMASAPNQFARTVGEEAGFSLVGFYPMDGDANDASGNKRHATDVQGISFVDGVDGQAAKFSGKTDSFIDLPINASVESMPQLTWGCWVRVDSLQPGGNELISTDDGNFDRTLTIDPRGAATEVHRFAALVGSNEVLASKGPRPKLGEWTFVACVYDNDKQTARLYVEDHLAREGRGGLVVTTSHLVSFGDCVQYVRLGMHADTDIEQLDGALDNVFLFSTALTFDQLEAIRAGGATALEVRAKKVVLP